MNIGDKIKIKKGPYTAYTGEILDFYGSNWVAVKISYRDQGGNITVPPDYLEVIEPATAFAHVDGLWDYYIPDQEDA